MKTLRIELPDRLAEELSNVVKSGLYRDEQEAVRLALGEFLTSQRAVLMERQQRADIDWALRHKSAAPS
jgi:Arc/MetJ-type ribon-helix-helix transcriptional regulator